MPARVLTASALLLALALPASAASLTPAPKPAPALPGATCAPLEAATDRPWQLQSFAESAGLSGLRIFDLCFTPSGDLWLATTGGLYHYDGYTWRAYGDADGLPSSFIRCVLLDRDGSLWVGSDHGAGIFDPERRSYSPRGDSVGLTARSVRHIDQDPDGTLWFSCDRWPDTSVTPGALLRLSEGKWRRFDSTDGLPMDYVIGHHRDSRGRDWAFTAQGWARREGERWAMPPETGGDLEARVLHMAEDSSGTLLAQGEGGPLRLRGSNWERVPANTLALHRSSSGELFAIERSPSAGTFWFSRWDGSDFVRLSAPTPMPPGALVYALREAPDHSIWCIGSGILLRWARDTGHWRSYPDLPPPLRRDASGRVWFHGGAELCWLDQAGLHRSTVSYSRILGFDADGAVLAVPEGQSLPVVFQVPAPSPLPGPGDSGSAPEPSSPESPAPPAACPLATVTHSTPDRSGRLWLLGTDADGHLALCHRQTQGWKIVSLGRASPGFVFSMRPDGPDGVSFTRVQRQSVDYEVLHADDSGIVLTALPTPLPAVPYPAYINAAESSWIQGYAGIFQGTGGTGGKWTRAPDTPSQGFTTLIGNDRELISVFRGLPGGKAGALSFANNAWRLFTGEFSGACYGDSTGRLFLLSRNGIHVRTAFERRSLEYIPLPAPAPPHSLVEDEDSKLWIGSADGVLNYIPGNDSPETRLVAPVSEVSQGYTLPLTFQGLHRFAPHASEGAFQFSWRVDGAPWCPFRRLDGPSLDISLLKPGHHRLEVRARDAEGNIDSSPALLDFEIIPLPLQSRAWFPWALGSLAGLLLGLAWLGISRSRHLARGNTKLRGEIEHRARVEKDLEEARDKLELRVAERTADLSRTNEELTHEIHERHELEKLRSGLEEQLLQAQKMQAIGTLAGGIAHDFNNILAIITPCTRMALEECITHPEVRENLQQVLAASERARRLVQQILTFSRRQPTNKLPVDLGEVVTEALKFMRSALSSGIRMDIFIEPGLPPILADATQIHQVVINLCSNAQQALREGRGTIGVTLRHGGTPSPDPDAFLAPPPRPHLTLLVSDDGIGMEASLLERIFDPFFTTKPTGQGTGLGLSVVDGIVKSHGGHIMVSSTPGEGSTFAVSFPVHLPSEEHTHGELTATDTARPATVPALARGPEATGSAKAAFFQASVAPAAPSSELGNTPPVPAKAGGKAGRILLVDDEPSVSRPLRIMLERAGFSVSVHDSPEQAHRAFSEAPHDYDLLLTDHSMAGMTGPDLAALLHSQRPGLPVILVTGYGGAWTPGDAARIGIHKVLTKPVDPAELVAEVRDAVSRGYGASAPSAS